MRHCLRILSIKRAVFLSNRRKGPFLTACKTFSTSACPDENPTIKLEEIPLKNIRNFSIIAHVDHGKSTLADRLLEITGAIVADSSNKQVLDKLQVERERGITVKAQTASLLYSFKGESYLLNLIDTPGHVDFSNEVSRSLAACQGVVLLVDANQGVQAQTVANFYLAFTNDLVIIPCLNKIDLKNADPDAVTQQLNTLFGVQPSEVLKISAKIGTGVESLLQAIIERIPPPEGDRDAPLRALLFDSWYDKYRGAIGLVYVKDGEVKLNDEVRWCYSNKEYNIKTLGVLRPQEVPVPILRAGQVGCISCKMRSTSEANIGDTLVLSSSHVEPLPGFSPAKPMVFAGVYPMDQSQHTSLRSAIEKLQLNDNAVSVTIDSSPALGHGWRLGFLGLLHMEVFSQRLEQEFDAPAIITSPSVTYKVIIHGHKNIEKYGTNELYISNIAHLPDINIVTEIHEPVVLGTIICPDVYIGDVIALCMEKRGTQQSAVNIDNTRVMLKFELPLNEIVVDFHDRLKSATSGFASFDYEDLGFQQSNLVKLNILLNGVEIDELSFLVHSSKAKIAGKKLCQKLLDIVPRQQFLAPQVSVSDSHEFSVAAAVDAAKLKGIYSYATRKSVAIQAKVGGKIVARENLKPYRKDVAAKLKYGGDVSRRMKLLKRQAEGKKHLKMVANIALPRETFIDVLKR